MHELPLIKSVHRYVMEYAEANHAKKIKSVFLQIGVLRDFVPRYISSYWDYVSKGSIAEGAKIYVEDIPISVECAHCKNVYFFGKEEVEIAKCPKCGGTQGKMLTGRELYLDHIDIE